MSSARREALSASIGWKVSMAAGSGSITWEVIDVPPSLRDRYLQQNEPMEARQGGGLNLFVLDAEGRIARDYTFVD